MPNNAIHEAKLQVLREIERALDEIQFGSIEVVLHEGRVTQIERRERRRLAVERSVAHVKRNNV